MTIKRPSDQPIRNIKLIIQYDGTRYSGWQIQRQKKTVQGELVKAIKKITGEKVIVYGASRTDAGVHALGQTANFRTHSRISIERFPHAINAQLNDDISVINASEVPFDFHSQFHAKGKKYRYILVNAYAPLPLMRFYSYYIRGKLDVGKMEKAASYFVGTMDFRAYGTEVARKKTTVRTIKSLEISENDEIITIEVDGNGFLYNMVRCMVGTLVQVGKGKFEPEHVKTIIKEGRRKETGPVVPANGLTLVQVYY